MKHDSLFSKIIVIIIIVIITYPLYNSNLNLGEEQVSEGMIIDDVNIIKRPSSESSTVGDSEDGLIGINALIPPPSLYTPADGSYITDITPYLDWYDVPTALEYQIQVDNTIDFSSPIEDTITIADGYQCGTLANGKFYWHVRARDALYMWTDYSDTWDFIIDTIPPGTVTLASPSNGASTADPTPTLSWYSASGANTYILQLDENPSFSSVNYQVETSSTSHTLPPILDGTHYWRVRAKDLAGNLGSWSSVRYFIQDDTPPGSPILSTPVDGTITNDNTLYFSWGVVTTAVQYHLQIDETITFSSPINYYTSGTSISPPALGQGVWYWRVQAKDSLNNWGSYSIPWDFIIDQTPPGTPMLLTPADDTIDSDATPTLTWTSASGANQYQLQIDDNPSFTSPTNYYTAGISFTLPTIANDEWFWHIRAIDAAGNYGSYSSTFSFIVDTIAPVIDDVIYLPDSVDDDDIMHVYCNISDLNGINNALLCYRVNGGFWTSTTMVWIVDDLFDATLGTFTYDDFIEFYITANDTAINPNSATDDNSGSYYSFTIVSSDLTGPSISLVSHDPTTPTDAETITISCEVIDDNDISSVLLYFRINGGSWTSGIMSNTEDNIYEITFGVLDYDDFVEYYVYAVDDSPNNNIAIDDNGGFYYSFTIVSSDVTPPEIIDISHEPVSPEDLDSITFSCNATDSNGINSVTLYYRIDGGSWLDSAMTNTNGDKYETTLGPFAYGDIIEYYFEAIDDSPNYNSEIDNNSGSYYSFTIGSSDHTAPVITDISHIPLTPNDSELVTFSCYVTDSNGIQSVTLYFRINGLPWSSVTMLNIDDDLYAITMGTLEYGYFVEYCIEAVDNSPNHNSVIDNNGGLYYSFIVTSGDGTAPLIEYVENDPITPTDLETTIFSCNVSDLNGIVFVTLHYRINGGSWIHVNMTHTAGMEYKISIGPFSYNAFIQYYVTAVDDSPNNNTATNDNEGSYYDFTVVSGDVDGPTISDINHSPSNPTTDDTVEISCVVVDANSIQSVKLYYRINDGSWIIIDMTLTTGDIYQATISSLSEGDVIEYYVVATDDSPNENVAIDNNTGTYYSFTITAPPTETPTVTPTETPTSSTPLLFIVPFLLSIPIFVIIRKRK